MQTFLEKQLEQVVNQKTSILSWIFGFIGVIFIRFILESLSNPTVSGVIASDSYTLVHYGLFYICTALALSCIVGFFIKDFKNILKIILFGLPVLWIAPILDIILSFGAGAKMSYIFNTGNALFFDFFKFFSPRYMYGATYGIRIEIIVIIFSIAWYVWSVTKNKLKAVLAGVASYTAIFILASIPGIFSTFSNLQPNIYINNLVFNSNIIHNTLHGSTLTPQIESVFKFGFDKVMSQILFVLSVFFGFILFYKIDSNKFKIILKNARPERIGSYIALLLSGTGFAYLRGLGGEFVWFDVVGMFCMIISWISLWMYAVHTNDIEDIEIDSVSNTDRPLVKKEITKEEMLDFGYIWLTLALLGSWSAGFYPFFMSLVYIACSHIYSCYPLRLRRFPFVSSFIISIASLVTILAGFFFVSADKHLQIFPMSLSIGIILMVALAINVKDMKDIEGDEKNGILTVPILFEKYKIGWGAKVTGLCFALSFLLVPIFLKFYFLYIVAIPCAYIGYKLVVKKPYRENPIFIVRFIFLLVVGILYTLTYWFATTQAI